MGKTFVPHNNILNSSRVNISITNKVKILHVPTSNLLKTPFGEIHEFESAEDAKQHLNNLLDFTNKYKRLMNEPEYVIEEFEILLPNQNNIFNTMISEASERLAQAIDKEMLEAMNKIQPRVSHINISLTCSNIYVK